jgi:hypothetical protein
MTRHLYVVFIGITGPLSGCLAGCDRLENSPAARAPSTAPELNVETYRVTARGVDYTTNLSGRARAYREAEIRTED